MARISLLDVVAAAISITAPSLGGLFGAQEVPKARKETPRVKPAVVREIKQTKEAKQVSTKLIVYVVKPKPPKRPPMM